MAKIPLLKKDKNGKIVILLHKDIYRSSIISNIVNSIDGIRVDISSRKHFRVRLETKNTKKALNFCNYLFSEHR